MQEEKISKCNFKRGANTLTWKKSYMYSKGVHFSFPLSLSWAGSERVILITVGLLFRVCLFFHSRKVIRDFSLGVIFVCYNINYLNYLNYLTSGAFWATDRTKAINSRNATIHVPLTPPWLNTKVSLNRFPLLRPLYSLYKSMPPVFSRTWWNFPEFFLQRKWNQIENKLSKVKIKKNSNATF